MKRYMIVAVALMLSALVCFNLGITQAQEGEAKYSYGEVVKTSSDQIVVREYDYDREAEVEVTYTIDSKTTFENVNSLKEVAEGDVVEIDYVVKNGKNIATYILVEKAIEEYTLPETYEEETEF